MAEATERVTVFAVIPEEIAELNDCTRDGYSTYAEAEAEADRVNALQNGFTYTVVGIWLPRN